MEHSDAQDQSQCADVNNEFPSKAKVCASSVWTQHCIHILVREMAVDQMCMTTMASARLDCRTSGMQADKESSENFFQSTATGERTNNGTDAPEQGSQEGQQEMVREQDIPEHIDGAFLDYLPAAPASFKAAAVDPFLLDASTAQGGTGTVESTASPMLEDVSAPGAIGSIPGFGEGSNDGIRSACVPEVGDYLRMCPMQSMDLVSLQSMLH